MEKISHFLCLGLETAHAPTTYMPLATHRCMTSWKGIKKLGYQADLLRTTVSVTIHSLVYTPNIPLLPFPHLQHALSPPKKFSPPKLNPVNILSSKSRISGCCVLFYTSSLEVVYLALETTEF